VREGRGDGERAGREGARAAKGGGWGGGGGEGGGVGGGGASSVHETWVMCHLLFESPTALPCAPSSSADSPSPFKLSPHCAASRKPLTALPLAPAMSTRALRCSAPLPRFSSHFSPNVLLPLAEPRPPSCRALLCCGRLRMLRRGAPFSAPLIPLVDHLFPMAVRDCCAAGTPRRGPGSPWQQWLLEHKNRDRTEAIDETRTRLRSKEGRAGGQPRGGAMHTQEAAPEVKSRKRGVTHHFCRWR